jgi:2,5-furandicarboxylate decarboxylase 1
MNDLRTFLSSLKAQDPASVVTIEEPVSADFEIAAIVKGFEATTNPVIIFRNVEGFSFPVAVNLIGSRERIAAAVGSPGLESFFDTWNRKMQNPCNPRVVPGGPVKEVVQVGEDVDITRFPIHQYFQQDAGRYITNSLMVVKDPETGLRNLSYSRAQLVNRNTLRNSMHSRGHQWMIYNKAERLNRNLEVAIVIGCHPVLQLAGATRFLPLGYDEFDLAGGLQEGPVDLVKCETIDLEVPASAEIVIEGEILANVREDEGPFGEYTGYASGRSTRNVLKVKAVTHRKDAFYQDLIGGNSYEHLLLMGVPKQALVFQRVRQVLPGVKQMCWPISGVNLLCFIQLHHPVDDGLPNLAGTLLLGLDSYVKVVVVVDEDINIYDEREVFWAISTRVDPSASMNVLKNVFCNRLDPAATEEGTVGKLIIDATKKKGGHYDRLTTPEEVIKKAGSLVKRYLSR